ncbi:hypothetical protein BDV93DRAFT_557036 [Ceratobasidium sp. AG-I]|nr:hypothetical protein BDV93DRAFT_557036 [Ceratobasidium sp. AG-I]
MPIHDSSKQPFSNSTLITGIHDFTESFKVNRTKWRAKVGGQTDEELQRLEFKLRHDEIAAAAGLVTSGGVLLTSLAFPLAAPPGAAGMALSNHRRQCAHDKLKFLRAMLAERGVKPHPDDFVHDALIPVMSGVLGSVASAGVSEFGLTAHLASVSIPTSTGGNTTAAVAHAISNINPDDIKSGATVFVQGAASGVMNESHQLLGHVIASAPVNVAHAGVFSDGVWVGDKIVDTIITTVMGTGVPRAVEMAIDTINSKRTKHCGWWCVECNVRRGLAMRNVC